METKQWITTCISIGLMSSGVLLSIFWMDIYRTILVKNLALRPEGMSYEIWKNPSFDVEFEVYLYNWTNPCKLTKSDFQKPIFQELGPYRFRETHVKTDVQWHNKNNTVSYRRKGTFHFLENESNGRLDDKVITINTFAVSVAYTVRNWNWILRRATSVVLNSKKYKQEVSIVKTAGELLFDGYEDALIRTSYYFSQRLPFKLKVPVDRFGWMYDRNESKTLTGHFNINTGQDDISKLGMTRTWNYQTATPYFGSPCNDVHGSGGEFYSPGLTKNSSIVIFHGELCRYLDLYFDKETEVNGVKSYRYAANELSVDNGSKSSTNKCFLDDDKVPSGMMNITACRYGSPLFVSFPHFYAADPYYLQSVDGLKPDKEKHQLFVTLEPETALPLELAGRLQINVLVQPTPDIALFKEAPTIFFPALWLQERVRTPDNLILMLKIGIWMPVIGYVCLGLVIFIGAALMAYQVYVFKKKKNWNTQITIVSYTETETKPE